MMEQLPVIVDAHCDTLMRLVGPAAEADVLSEKLKGHLDLDRLIEAGVGVQVFALFTQPELGPALGLRRVFEMIAHFHRSVAASGGRLHPVTSRGDLSPAAGRVGGLLSIEGMGPLGESIELLEVLHHLGVRSGMLTWNDRNALADGAFSQDSAGGLSAAGRRFVQRMQELGWVLDVSHLGDRGFWDLLERTEGPLIASHSNARSLRVHNRNITDDQIRAIAARDGVIGMNFYTGFIVDGEHAEIGDLLRHIRHIGDLVGTRHVGLGSDFDGIGSAPEGLESVLGMPRLRDEILREFGEDEARGILGENFRRVLAATLPEGDAA